MWNLFLSMLMLMAIASPAGAVLIDQEPSNNTIAMAAIQITIDSFLARLRAEPSLRLLCSLQARLPASRWETEGNPPGLAYSQIDVT